MAATDKRDISRRRLWTVIAVALFAVAAMVVAVVVLSDGDDDNSLRDRLVDLEWTLLTVDGVVVTAERPPTFILQSDGRVVGFDGCNQYGFDLSEPDGWTLTDDTLRIDQPMVSTAMACPDVPIQVIPVADDTELALDANGILTLTSSSGRVFTAAA